MSLLNVRNRVSLYINWLKSKISHIGHHCTFHCVLLQGPERRNVVDGGQMVVSKCDGLDLRARVCRSEWLWELRQTP
jgi:hypothetical protein